MTSTRSTLWTLLAVLLVAAVAAGCLGGDDGGTAQAPSGGDGDATDDGNATGPGPGPGPSGDDDPNATQEPLGPPEERTLHLTAGPGLAAAPPAEQDAVAIPSGPESVAVDRDLAVFQTEPLEEPLVLSPEEATITLWLQTRTVAPSNGVFDITLWFGSTRGLHHLGGGPVDAPALTPGEPVEVQLPMGHVGESGSYVPAGESLQVQVGQLMTHPRGVEIAVGNETPSRVSFTARSANVTPLQEASAANETTLEGTIPAGVDAACDAVEGVTTQVHDVSVAEGADRLELTLEPQGTPLREDLDMFLVDGDETVLGTSSIDGTENMLLAGPLLEDLAGQDLTLRVAACSAHATSYTVNVAQG